MTRVYAYLTVASCLLVLGGFPVLPCRLAFCGSPMPLAPAVASVGYPVTAARPAGAVVTNIAVADYGTGRVHSNEATVTVVPVAHAGLDPSTAAGAPASVGPDGEPPYLVRPRDVISVRVVDEPTYTGLFEVSPAGTITFADQMLNEIPAAGRTVDEIQSDLARQLGQYVRDPQVDLALKSFGVVVSGSVRSPSEHSVALGTRLLDVIEKAVSDEQLLARVFVRRRSGEVVQYRPVDFMRHGAVSENPVVQPGDAIGVGGPPAGSGLRGDEYEVQGAVKKQGRFPLWADQPTRVWEAFLQAGGATEDADLGRAVLRRSDGTSLRIDLGRADGDPDSPSNPPLANGDVLFVPRLTTTVYMLGAVRNPGEMRVAEETTVLEAIAKAGGLSGPARIQECAILRQKPEAARIAVDLQKVLEEGLPADNPVLQHGDTVWVPPEVDAKHSTWGRVNETLRTLWFLAWL